MQCGNRCLKCVSKECPYVFMLSGGAAGFTKARVPSAKTLRARVRIKTKYDKLVTAKKVYADMKSYEKCLDLRHEVPTPTIILLVSRIMCVQGIFEFPEICHEFAHLIPADKVDEVLACLEGLDPKFAVLTHLTRFIGIWWKHASKDSVQELTPKCERRHNCEKIRAFVMPVDHAGHRARRAVLKAKNFKRLT